MIHHKGIPNLFRYFYTVLIKVRVATGHSPIPVMEAESTPFRFFSYSAFNERTQRLPNVLTFTKIQLRIEWCFFVLEVLAACARASTPQSACGDVVQVVILPYVSSSDRFIIFCPALDDAKGLRMSSCQFMSIVFNLHDKVDT